MPRSQLLIVSVAFGVVLILLASWLARGGGPAIARTAGPLGQASPEETLFADSTFDASLHREAVDERADALAGATTPTNESSSPTDIRDARELTVVRANSHVPVEGATLRVWDPGTAAKDTESEFERALQKHRLDELLATDTQTFVTDALGRARIPRSNVARWAVAERDDEWGLLFLDPDERSQEKIVLHRDFALDVRVVDAARRPLSGISVATRVRYWSDGAWNLQSARTDAEGNARIQHVGWTCATNEIEPHQALTVGISEPLEVPVEFEFDLTSPPTARIDLVAPLGGTLEIRLVDSERRPIAGEHSVELYRIRRDAEQPEEYESFGISGVAWALDGVALFRCVPLDCEFEAQVNIAASPEWYTAIGRGPTSLGAGAVLVVECDVRAAIVGRVLDVDGTPLASREIHAAACDSEGEEFDSISATTDAAGRFEAPLYRPEDFHSFVVWTETDNGGRVGSGRVTLQHTQNAERIDVGDVRLEALPLLAEGRVIDDAGRPVPNARVSARVRRTRADFRGQPQVHWEFLWTARTRSDEAGRFELRSSESGEGIALYARRDELWHGPTMTQAGARGLELVVEAAGSVRGSIVCEGLVKPELLRITLSRTNAPPSDSSPTEDEFQTGVDRDGRFALTFVPSGTYDATIELQAEENVELARIEGLVVRPGEVNVDPRLDPARVAWRGVIVRCVDEQGRRVFDASMCKLLNGDENDLEYQHSSTGEFMFDSDELPTAVWFTAEGFLARRVDAVQSTPVIELRRAPRVRMVFTANGPLPCTEFGVEWVAEDAPQDSPWRHEWSDFDFRSPLELNLRHEGQYQLRFHAYIDKGDAHAEIEIEGVTPNRLRFDARNAEQTIPIQLDAARIQAAIDAAGTEFDEGNEDDER